MVLNPNGVMFGTDATVNVGGLIASTGMVDDSEFMAGDFSIAGASVGSISNQGIIKLSDGGLAAFIAPSVSNSGTITTDNGRICQRTVGDHCLERRSLRGCADAGVNGWLDRQ